MVMAAVYAQAGEADKAMDELEELLSIQSYFSATWLSVDPLFDSLRGNPRFEELLKRDPPRLLQRDL